MLPETALPLLVAAMCVVASTRSCATRKDAFLTGRWPVDGGLTGQRGQWTLLPLSRRRSSRIQPA